jgi:hypothetical protein
MLVAGLWSLAKLTSQTNRTTCANPINADTGMCTSSERQDGQRQQSPGRKMDELHAETDERRRPFPHERQVEVGIGPEHERETQPHQHDQHGPR